MNLPKNGRCPSTLIFLFCCGREQFRIHPEFASQVREGINKIRACRFWREASRPAVQKSTMRTVYISSGGLIANMATIPKPVVPASDWRENDPLLTPQQVAERLNTSLDWVWDHSSRKMPLLAVILIEFRRFLDSQVPREQCA